MPYVYLIFEIYFIFQLLKHVEKVRIQTAHISRTKNTHQRLIQSHPANSTSINVHLMFAN